MSLSKTGNSFWLEVSCKLVKRILGSLCAAEYDNFVGDQVDISGEDAFCIS